MAHAVVVRPGCAPAEGIQQARGFVGWIGTSNPFYVISALLVWLGLWVSFGGHAHAAQTWALMAGMTGYTVLLAATACLLVRFVGVWDDVRTVMLLVVLMFLATSVTFDELLARDPARGIACYFGGLACAVALSEAMLRGARLGLPWPYRLPYHLFLALFYLYPVALTPLLDRPRSEALGWALFGFAPAAGVVALTLIPAIRRGRGALRGNGSPWPWAWYPWVLFGVLAFGVAGRSALLCYSMHHLGRGAAAEPYIFGAYFLVPFLLAVAVLLLEIGRVERHAGTLRVALAMPAVLAVLACVGHRPEAAYQTFLGQFEARLGGTPLYWTLLASAAFYGYAALRRVPRALDGLTAALAALVIVAPTTRDLDGLVAAQPLPLLAIGALQGALGLSRRDAWRGLVGACALAGAATVALPVGEYRVPVAFHLALLAVLAIGAARDDALHLVLRNVGAAAVLLACLAVQVGSGKADPPGDLPPWLLAAYPPAMAALIAAYGLALGHRASLVVAGLVLAGWLAALGWRGYLGLRHVVVGLDSIVLGLIFFALAILVSAGKGGLLRRPPADLAGKAPPVLD